MASLAPRLSRDPLLPKVLDTGCGEEGHRKRVEVQLLEVITSTAPSFGEETKAQRGNSSAQGHMADSGKAMAPAETPRNAEHQDPGSF